ncbi:ATP-binding protein [Bacterioplanes sanyensis]|uniref:ATP-binding protein n=1 Tax=Bacterioplanes sanyensis TaxID=1249553 RepID=A0A222FN50_9GAMM|nr:DUF2062 domain-containing protein [Bacterioplanes sanyensis]ASP39986.1 ATP-binding protein [Bacterioplanes sanyensis]
MPKKLLRKVFPSPEQVQQNESLRFLRPLFNKPNLWHLNRRSVARAFFVGLFAAFLPLPFQMVIAAFIAFYANANVPISVGLVWVSNPITIPPLFYATYRLGVWLLDAPQREFSIELSLDWLLTELGQIWQPLWVGSLTAGLMMSTLGFLCVRAAWRWHAIANWQRRRLNRQRLHQHKDD